MGIHQLPPFNNEDIFDQAICDLANRITSSHTFKRYGRKGHNQHGIDIFSPEKNWAIQCKKKDLTRNDKALLTELLNDIDAGVQKVISENVLDISIIFFASTFKDHPILDNHCVELMKRYETTFTIMYWGWDSLQGMFLEHKDLLVKYWPKFIGQNLGDETSFQRNLNLKKKIECEFRLWLNYLPENRERNSKLIIRDVDGNQYPNSNFPDANGEYSWFSAEIKSLYHKGMEFYTAVKSISISEDGTWDLIYASENVPENSVKVFEVSRINFQDIIDYDIKGDEYYICPHIYCKFRHLGTPFEEKYYIECERPYMSYTIDRRRST